LAVYPEAFGGRITFNEGPSLAPEPPAILPLGVLAPLQRDPEVSEILVTGTSVAVERKGRIEAAGITFSSVEAVLSLAYQIATAGGRELSMAQPYQTVAAGSARAALTIPPYSRLPTISIRCHQSHPLGDSFFLEQGTVNERQRDWLLGMIGDRKSFIVAGAAGSGKTTLLRWLVSRMPPTERIVLVEEVPELHLQEVHPQVVELVTRPPNKEGRYGINVREAAQHALHLRPDRMAVGEIRGAEAIDWLVALTTGHHGSFSTVHAPSVRLVIGRLAWLAHLASPLVAPEQFERAFQEELPVVLFMRRLPDGRRVLSEVMDGGKAVILGGDRES